MTYLDEGIAIHPDNKIFAHIQLVIERSGTALRIDASEIMKSSYCLLSNIAFKALMFSRVILMNKKPKLNVDTYTYIYCRKEFVYVKKEKRHIKLYCTLLNI